MGGGGGGVAHGRAVCGGRDGDGVAPKGQSWGRGDGGREAVAARGVAGGGGRRRPRERRGKAAC